MTKKCSGPQFFQDDFLFLLGDRKGKKTVQFSSISQNLWDYWWLVTATNIITVTEEEDWIINNISGIFYGFSLPSSWNQKFEFSRFCLSVFFGEAYFITMLPKMAKGCQRRVQIENNYHQRALHIKLIWWFYDFLKVKFSKW